MQRGVQEIFLPGVQNRAVSLSFDSDLTGINTKASLSLDIFDGVWTIHPNKDVKFASPVKLSDGLRIDARLIATGEEIVILVELLDLGRTRFTKYIVVKGTHITLGSGNDNLIRYNTDGLVSRKHLTIEPSPGGAVLVDHNSQNGSFINGKRVNMRQNLNYGDTIYIFGLKLIWLESVLAVNDPKCGCEVSGLRPIAATDEAGSKAEPAPIDEFYSRSPRRMPRLDENPVELEAPPNPNQEQAQPLWRTIGPAITMVIPMGIGILVSFLGAQNSNMNTGVFMFMGLFTSLAAATIGVFWALMGMRYQKKREKENEEKRQKRYSEYLDRMEREISGKHARNRTALSEGYPHSTECMRWIVTQDHRLWERNVNHPDILTVRLGMGAIRSINPVEAPKERFSLVDDELAERPFDIQKKYEMLTNVPIRLSLLENKLVGVIGEDRGTVLETARILTAQISALHSYTDVKMVFIVPSNEDWGFAKWLPHVWSEDNSIRLIANDPNSTGEVLYHLSGVLRDRNDKDRQRENILPYYILFIADPNLVENEAIIKQITSSGQELGFSAVLLYDRLDRLPNTCTAIIQRDRSYSGYYSLDHAFDDYEGVSFDTVPEGHLDEISRIMSGVKVREAEGSGAIPQMLTFLDMYKTGEVNGIDIYRNWLENRTYESMKALIGERGGGTPVYLDIHEKYHGPHGLVAGTTGSGKSEMLQTYILSLAVSYHPHEVSFILIDYKGGGMAESFKALTHVAGIITNLGGNQTNRALASIRSEIKRRQAVFNEYKIKHIDDYIELYRADKAGDPMPHLLIIADEFAELKKEQPDFVRELVSASRVGRSLGVHLILATQKPDGVVDEQIWSNTKFRVCLRVAEKSDSMGMLKHPVAAYITQPGRGYFQVGNDEIFEEFQSGWSGARYEPEIPFTDEKSSDVKMINLWGRPSVLSVGKKQETSSVEKVIQLDAMTAYIAKIAEQHGIKAISNVWLPPLPKLIFLDELPKADIPAGELAVPIGLMDDPVMQEQRTVTVNFTQNNHMLVAASAAGGKTMFMQTVLYGLVMSKTPDQLHIYIADFGSRTLGVFGVLPHVGGIVFDDDPDRVDKLIALLMKELNKRKLHFASKSLGSFKEYSKQYDDVPAVLLVIDNFPAFLEGNPRQEENLQKLAGEAASYGIYMMISCTNYSDIRGRLRQNIRSGIGFQLPGKFEYDEVLGNRGNMTAEEGCPGRGLVKMDSPDQKESRSLEFQAALCIKTDDTSLINTKLSEKFKEIADGWQGSYAVRIPQVPSDMTFDAFKEYPETKEALRNGLLPLGYDVQEAQLISLDLEELFCYVISGGMRSGKTNTIKMFALLAAEKNTNICIIDTSAQLTQFATEHDITCLVTADDIFNWMEQTLVPEFQRRNENIKNAGGRKFSKQAQAGERQMLILIHDFSGFMSAVSYDERDMTSFLEAMVKMGNGHKITIAAVMTRDDSTAHSHSPFYSGFISWKSGLHLGGQADNQRVLEFDINYSESSKKLPPGYCHTVVGSNTVVVITPEV